LGEVIRADWYDLADDSRAETLDWLNTVYFPAVQALPGIAWVGHYSIVQKSGKPPTPGSPPRNTVSDPSVPTGGEYLMLTAATAPDIFIMADSALARLEDELAERLGRRIGHRRAVFIQECAVNGPEYGACLPGTGPAPAVQLGNLNAASIEAELELARFYRMLRFPQVSTTEGCIGARKLVSILGWGKHGILYEFTSMHDDEELFEMRFERAPLSSRPPLRHVLHYVIHGPRGPAAGRRIWPE